MPTNPKSLYLADNGRCYCGEHLGATARSTGRDTSGQCVERLDAREVLASGMPLDAFRCEAPRCGRFLLELVPAPALPMLGAGVPS